jgi:hypothetical protein
MHFYSIGKLFIAVAYQPRYISPTPHRINPTHKGSDCRLFLLLNWAKALLLPNKMELASRQVHGYQSKWKRDNQLTYLTCNELGQLGKYINISYDEWYKHRTSQIKQEMVFSSSKIEQTNKINWNP